MQSKRLISWSKIPPKLSAYIFSFLKFTSCNCNSNISSIDSLYRPDELAVEIFSFEYICLRINCCNTNKMCHYNNGIANCSIYRT